MQNQKQRPLDFKEINLAVNFEELFVNSTKFEVNRTGEGFRGDCPFCQGRNTFTVGTSNNVFHCKNAGCNIGGDSIKFIAKLENISDKEAAKKLNQNNIFKTNVTTQKKTINSKTPELKNSPEKIKEIAEIYNNASKCGQNEYLKRKKIKPYPGLRFGNDLKGNKGIIVPLRNIKGELTSLQYINDKGKFYHFGMSLENSFTPIGDISKAEDIYLAEGLATATTIWMAFDENLPIISVGSQARMEKFIKYISNKYPEKKIIVCLDKGEESLKLVNKIKNLFNVSFRMPNFTDMVFKDKNPTDFNDLVSKCNQPLGVVKKQLMKEFMLTKKEIIPAQETNSERQNRINIEFLFEKKTNFITEKPPEQPRILSLIDGGTTTTAFLPKGIVAMIVGAGGIGKTHFLTQLAIAIANNENFLGKFLTHEKGNVFMLLGENNDDDIHRLINKTFNHLYPTSELKAKKIDLIERLAVSTVTGKNASLIDKNNEPTEFYKNLLQELKDKEPSDGWSLIILDPIARFLGGNAENDNSAATQFISLLERMIMELKGKPTILVAHHMNKSGLSGVATDQGAARGSSALTDGVRWQSNLEHIKKSSTENEKEYKVKEFTLRHVKSNHTAIISPQTITRNDFGNLTIKAELQRG